MTRNDRISTIYALKKEITLLNSHRAPLEVELRYTELSIQEKNEIQIKLDKINGQLRPLIIKLNDLRTLYYIKYNGTAISMRSWQKETDTYEEYVFLNTNCNIDTTTDKGWENINPSDPLYKDLKTDISEYLLVHKGFSDPEIIHIKRIKQ